MARIRRDDGKAGRGQRALRLLLALGILVGGLALAPQTAGADLRPSPFQPFPYPQNWSQPIAFQSQYTAGSVNTSGKFNQTYGRFEIRAKMPQTGRPLRDGTSIPTNVAGLQFAYWLWPEDVLKYGTQWPMSGEIDVMEWYGACRSCTTASSAAEPEHRPRERDRPASPVRPSVHGRPHPGTGLQPGHAGAERQCRDVEHPAARHRRDRLPEGLGVAAPGSTAGGAVPTLRGRHCRVRRQQRRRLGSGPVADGAGGFLERLSAADRERLAGAGRERSFQPGDVVMTQGSRSDAVAVLLSGAVRVVAGTPEGAEVTLSLRGAGDLLGTLGALTDPPAPRAATIVAILPSHARLIATRTFLELLHDRPAIAVALLAELAGEWRESSDRHLQFSAYPAEQRLARLLIELCRTNGGGRAAGEHSIDLPLSQTDLAGMIGASRDSAARVLARFREEGLVATGRRSVQVTDLAGLQIRAHPDP